MAIQRKVLWIVNMDTAAQESAFMNHVSASGVDTVCIRTSSTRLASSISSFKAKNLSVWAWRWPSINPHSAMAEAEKVAKVLIPAGLEGYVVDPESDKAGDSNDWNSSTHAGLAQDFCQTITQAAPAGFLFGTTSGCKYPSPTGKPDIPWDKFFAASQALYPQCYWRANLGTVKDINGGTPGSAIKRGLGAWAPKSQGKPIIPMAGEIDLVTVAEIKAYGAELENRNITEAHFYADTPKVSAPVLKAISQI